VVEGKFRTLELSVGWLEAMKVVDVEVVLLEVGLLAIDGDGVTTEAEEIVVKVILRVGAVGRTTVLVGSAVGVGVGMFRVGAVARVVETTWVVVGAANASVHVTPKKSTPTCSGSGEVVVEQV
jgi:hypothetical protein